MTTGYINTVKTAVIAHIADADADLEDEGDNANVLGSWQIDIWTLNELPVVTVRVTSSNDHEVAMGRKLSTTENGIYTTFFFTAHVFESVSESGDASESAMELAEKIKEQLLKSDDASTSGIVWYERITIREAPTGMERVARVILEGYVFCKRPFSS
jgi:hypothetical protein